MKRFTGIAGLAGVVTALMARPARRKAVKKRSAKKRYSAFPRRRVGQRARRQAAPSLDPANRLSAVETVLRLYVVGGTQLADRAVGALRRLQAEHLGDSASVEIVDLAERPEVAEQEGILATPLLVRVAPEPVRRIVGDLSDVDRVRWSLGLVGEDGA